MKSSDSPRFEFARHGGRVKTVLAGGVALVLATVALAIGLQNQSYSLWSALSIGLPFLAVGVLICMRMSRVSVRVIGDLFEARNFWWAVKLPVSAVEHIGVEWLGRRPLQRPAWRGQAHTASGVVRLTALDTLMVGPRTEQAVIELREILGLTPGPVFVERDAFPRR